MRLIILNGPWGVGEEYAGGAIACGNAARVPCGAGRNSTGLATMTPMQRRTFALLIRIASDIIERCLEEGRDVIVDKMLRASDLLDDIRMAGNRHGATVHEVILWASKDTVLARGA